MSDCEFILCGQCTFFRDQMGAAPKAEQEGGHVQGACWRKPPAAQLAGGQNPITGEKHVSTIAYRPPVWEFEGCGDGRPRGPAFLSGVSSGQSRIQS